MTAYQDHEWCITLGRDDEEYRRWQRTCNACGDRVTAFRSTAIYQLGRDFDAIPHAVPLSNWQTYTSCSAPASAASLIAEQQEQYPQPKQRQRGLRPIPPARAVEQLIERVKAARRMTNEQLAEAIDVDPRQLHRWRSGAQPGGYALLRLARLALLTQQPVVIRPLVRRHSAPA